MWSAKMRKEKLQAKGGEEHTAEEKGNGKIGQHGQLRQQQVGLPSRSLHTTNTEGGVGKCQVLQKS